MKRKQLVTGALSVMMLGAMVAPIQAKDMNVTYTEPNQYTVSIPASVDFQNEEFAKTKSIKVGVTDVNIAPSIFIEFSITSGLESGGIMKLKRESDDSTMVQTTVSKLSGDTAEVIEPNKVFMRFMSNGTEDLQFSDVTSTEPGDIKAGTYTGILTFEVSAVKYE